MTQNITADTRQKDIDVVLIGVNSAPTLENCIKSVLESDYASGKLSLYYVDGGSTDNSMEIAKRFDGVQVLTLKASRVTPGMGRNAGFLAGSSEYVQFMDSDTVLHPQWLSQAVSELDGKTAAVFGTRREAYPEATVYNSIADLEWNPAPGVVDAFGGDVLTKRSVLEKSGLYDETLVAGEDPELSLRIRALGYEIRHLPLPMTTHDLAMRSARQYIRRGFRTGYGYAAVYDRVLAGCGAEGKRSGDISGFWEREIRRIAVRGGIGGGLLVAGLTLALPGFYVSLALIALGLGLILFPRIFRVGYFMKEKSINAEQARKYAWHCSLAVLPQLAGIMRYLYAKATGNYLTNKPRGLGTNKSLALLIIISALAVSCAQLRPVPTRQEQGNATNATAISEKQFQSAFVQDKKIFADGDKVEELSADVPEVYLLGPGDVLKLLVWHRPEVSMPKIVVAPDGNISIPRIGIIKVEGRTIHGVSVEISDKLKNYYEEPEVTLSVEEFKNNKAFVLGRVANPGVVHFPGKGTLLEALALAGGLPVIEKDAFLTRCAIIRGKKQILWINLRSLLNEGNISLNARLMNNDVIYIPESEDELVYVMGEVFNPGAIRLKSRLTLLDAIMVSGGPTRNADLEKVYLIRFDQPSGQVREINVRRMIETAVPGENFLVQSNDVIFVAETGMGQFNYFLKQLLPSLTALDLGSSIAERFGVMQFLRNKAWGQDGFVNSK